ncbi:response regulator [Paraburkholderia sp. SIMBA_030]|uniref:response regulator n=1 Tax=Paraburkholderia sp. SIMBA_030 TaxID=3085773 RepID=UPI003978D148
MQSFVLADPRSGRCWERGAYCQRDKTIQTIDPSGNAFCQIILLAFPSRLPVSTILLVDDDFKILHPLRMLLEAEGFRVVLARDGETGATVTANEHPDLIVTDWMMPGVDGVTFCRRLKADAATSRIPVVMLSGALPPSPAERSMPMPLSRMVMTASRGIESPSGIVRGPASGFVFSGARSSMVMYT